jgi:hypothetical protein
VFAQQPVWKFLGNRFVEAYIHVKAPAEKKTTFGSACFLCGPSVATEVPELKRATVQFTMRD